MVYVGGIVPTLKRSSDGSGAYTFGDKDSDKRWTAYVVFPFDKAALALDIDGLVGVFEGGDASMEEIDINAPNYHIAMAVASAALERDYEDGGKIVQLDERVGMYL